MKTIEFFIKKTSNTVVPPFYSCKFNTDNSSTYRSPEDTLSKQAKEMNVEIGLHLVDLKDIPTHVNAFLVGFLDENSLVPDDYLSRIISMNNLHRNAAMFCGPVYTNSAAVLNSNWLPSHLVLSYRTYDYDGFTQFISCYLNNDPNHYPPLNGSIFSARSYNECGGYSCKTTPRGPLEENHEFLRLIDKSGPMIYNSRLSTGYFITSEELQTQNFVKYYYQMGYNDGLKCKNTTGGEKFLSHKNILEIEYNVQHSESKNKRKKLINPIKGSQEAMAEELTSPSGVDDKYDTLLASCKCMYDVGFYEAMAGAEIL